MSTKYFNPNHISRVGWAMQWWVKLFGKKIVIADWFVDEKSIGRNLICDARIYKGKTYVLNEKVLKSRYQPQEEVQ